MSRLYLAFLRGVSVNWLSRTGSGFATASLIHFVILEFFRIIGVLNNAYLGLITYLVFPTMFVAGLLLIPFGWWIYSRKTGESIKSILSLRFEEKDIKASAFGSGLIKTIGALTLLNLVFLGAVSARALHFMDSATFCGTACHSVMNPEWVTYQQSPHSRVACVECHVGEGVDALIDAKLNGAWQMVSLAFDLYERPIPTPVHTLRPARETCEKCHWPDKMHGNRIKNIVHFALDSASTPKHTTLAMKIGSGREGMDEGSHWHVAEKNEVLYASVDDEREEMLWVKVRQPDGSYKQYQNRNISSEQSISSEHVRTMDCVDCHNRATHIYEQPDVAVDDRIAQGLISRELPFIKERASGALTSGYPDQAAAMKGIEAHIGNYYRQKHPAVFSAKSGSIQMAVAAVQDIYKRNIHQRMNITWGSYSSHLQHRDGRGCFRCHNKDMVDDAGSSIFMDCTQCHSILGIESDKPFSYLYSASDDSSSRDYMQEKYLHEEFRESSSRSKN